MSQTEATDVLIKHQLVFDKVQTLLTKILQTQENRQELRTARAFFKFKSLVQRDRVQRNRRIAYLVFEKKLVCLARHSSTGTRFNQWKSVCQILKTEKTHKAQLQVQFDKIQRTVANQETEIQEYTKKISDTDS